MTWYVDGERGTGVSPRTLIVGQNRFALTSHIDNSQAGVNSYHTEPVAAADRVTSSSLTKAINIEWSDGRYSNGVGEVVSPRAYTPQDIGGFICSVVHWWNR